MSTGFDAAPRRHGWWVVPEVAAFAILAALVVPYLGATAGQSGLHAEAAARGSRLLESASPAEHHDHGHEVTAADQVFCGIDVFGTDPPTATIVEEVRTVYGYYFCAVGRPGVPYLMSSRSDGPVVVSFVEPPAITIALSGAGYQERVRAIMPDQYEQFCYNGLPDPTVAADVKRRYEAAIPA